MDETRVFISYSRQELYFAESLALNLKARGLSVWMDIQELEPGSDWAEGIHQGLEQCTVVVLVASRKSLRSPYVQDEWMSALKAGKPIYIACFEAVTLPPVLAENPQVSWFNFRHNFNRQLGRLVEALKSGTIHKDSIQPWRFLFLPLSHWVILASVLIPSLILLVWLVLILLPGFYIPETIDSYALRHIFASINVVVVWSYMTIVGLFYSVAFLRRRFDPYVLLILPFSFIFVLWYAYLALDGITHGQYIFRATYVPLNTPDFVFIEILFFGIAVTGFLFQRRSSDVLRWMPLGQAPQWLRQRINTRLIPKPASSLSSGFFDRSVVNNGQKYQIFFNPADEPVAHEVRMALTSTGYKRATEADSESPSLGVFILSNNADLRQMKQEAGAALPGHVLAVIASSIKMSDQPEELFHYQWVDYRQHSPEQFSHLADVLRKSGTGNLRRGLSVVPEGMESIVLPRGIYYLTNALRFIGSFALSAGLYILILLMGGKETSALSLALLPVGVAFFVLADRLAMRWIHLRAFLIMSMVLGVLTIILNLGGLLWVVLQHYGADPYTGQPTFWGYLYLILVLVTPVAVVVYYRDLLRRWLPLPGKGSSSEMPFQLSPSRLSLGLYAISVVILTIALLANTPL